MRTNSFWNWLATLIVCASTLPPATTLRAQNQPPASSTNETPQKFVPTNYGFDHERREVMIPMRDSVKLFTVILIPKGTRNAPILMTRTPYDAKGMSNRSESAHLGPRLQGYDNAVDVIIEGGYIRVIQDVRGKHGSEGEYVMNRPPHGPWNPTFVDDATDTYDTIDWLIKNVPESNGKVGVLGISYDGFLPLMAVIHPHPALKVSIAMNPMVDGWMGDDWFHNGAFRQVNLSYFYNQEGTKDNSVNWYTTNYDVYDMFMEAGSAGELARRRGLEQVGFWRKILEHPSYDAFWQEQAMDKVLAAEPLKVPLMLVHSIWDQEDIYGAPAVYKALKPKDTNNDMVYMVLGPWHHGQEIDDGSALGPIRFESNTAYYFRQNILAPFLAQYLKDNGPKSNVSVVSAFETGTNRWLRLPTWPAGCEGNCTIKPTPLYLNDSSTASFSARNRSGSAFDEYISDPAKPVLYINRPVQGNDPRWSSWLVTDQRDAASRPDVLSFTSDKLTAPVKISGQPLVNLIASTSGTDVDWVVKLIDVYPDEVACQPEMGGYQLMISADIFRGRYREGYNNPKPVASNKALPYRWALPNANHVFLPGHRIMVQIQSSWFPLYDRNPQTFVKSIFWAKAEDYKKAVHRVYHSAEQKSYIELPLVQNTVK
jgi:uncharacterized protein